jgi:hypothetical protein
VNSYVDFLGVLNGKDVPSTSKDLQKVQYWIIRGNDAREAAGCVATTATVTNGAFSKKGVGDTAPPITTE